MSVVSIIALFVIVAGYFVTYHALRPTLGFQEKARSVLLETGWSCSDLEDAQFLYGGNFVRFKRVHSKHAHISSLVRAPNPALLLRLKLRYFTRIRRHYCVGSDRIPACPIHRSRFESKRCSDAQGFQAGANGPRHLHARLRRVSLIFVRCQCRTA